MGNVEKLYNLILGWGCWDKTLFECSECTDGGCFRECLSYYLHQNGVVVLDHRLFGVPKKKHQPSPFKNTDEVMYLEQNQRDDETMYYHRYRGYRVYLMKDGSARIFRDLGCVAVMDNEVYDADQRILQAYAYIDARWEEENNGE